jgi:hypothetical protein
MTIGRVHSLDGSHTYVDEATGDRYDAVTAILSATNSKPWLTAWAAKLAAEFAVEHHTLVGETLEEVGRDAAVDLIKGAAKRRRDLKADVGSFVHTVIEALLLDRALPAIPDELMGQDYDGEPLTPQLVDAIVDGLLSFFTDFGISDRHVLMAEATVADPDLLVAGTLDLVLELPNTGLTPVVDTKTGINLDASWKQQLSAYRHMPVVWLPNGQRAPMPTTNARAVLHLRRDYEAGYKLFVDDDLDADERDYRAFRRNHASFLWQRAAKLKPGRVLYPPLPDGSQPPPLLEDLEGVDGFSRCRGALRKHGIRSLGDLAALTETQCRALHGIGPAAIVACRAALEAYGLAFTDNTTQARGVA